MPLEQLTQYGITDLDISWERLTLDTTQSFEAQEQQIIVLGEGDRLTELKDNDTKTITTLEYAAK